MPSIGLLLLLSQYVRISDAADLGDVSGPQAVFNAIGKSYRMYMQGDDDAVAALDGELMESFGEWTATLA